MASSLSRPSPTSKSTIVTQYELAQYACLAAVARNHNQLLNSFIDRLACEMPVQPGRLDARIALTQTVTWSRPAVEALLSRDELPLLKGALANRSLQLRGSFDIDPVADLLWPLPIDDNAMIRQRELGMYLRQIPTFETRNVARADLHTRLGSGTVIEKGALSVWFSRPTRIAKDKFFQIFGAKRTEQIFQKLPRVFVSRLSIYDENWRQLSVRSESLEC